jgi:diguanylate cyclase (GGDEF)-like protein
MSAWRILAFGLTLFLPLSAVADTVRVGGDHDYAPFEFINEAGEADGFHVDLLKAIGELSGFEPEFQFGPWRDVREAMANDEIDLLASFVVDFRTGQLDYATPHLIVHHEIFVRQNDRDIGGLDSLAGREVIVQQGDFVEGRLAALDIDMQLIRVPNQGDALRLLTQGQHDAAIINEHVGRRMLEEGLGDRLTTTGAPLFPASYAFAARAGSDELMGKIEAALAELKASGEFNRLRQRWLAAGPTAPDADPVLHWALVAMPLILTGVLLVMIWRQSRQHPQEESQAVFAARFRRDGLTGLPNRVELEQAVANAIERARTDHFPRALLHINLDQFKLINQEEDYQGGDTILCRIAEFLRRRSHLGELPARIGGDQFALLLGPSRDPLATAEQIRHELEDMDFEIDDRRIQVTASIGVATLDDHAISVGELLKQAEAACYAAKEAGRNRVHAFTPDDEALIERHEQMRWVREVSLALKENRLRLYFQTIEPARPNANAEPIVEILLRLECPDGTIASAGEFVPAAEKYFVAHRLDRWVVRNTLAWMEAHGSRLAHLRRVFINLSARSLGDDRFLPFALEQLATHDVAKEKVGFEITETAVMTQLKTGLNTIEHLRNLGCQFALDDFGVGVSSMAYLKNLPIDVLKIDGSFALNPDTGERDRAVLREINDLGHTLGKTTVMECVETEEQRQWMAELGIDWVQGFAVSEPRPLPELLDDPRLAGV